MSEFIHMPAKWESYVPATLPWLCLLYRTSHSAVVVHTG